MTLASRVTELLDRAEADGGNVIAVQAVREALREPNDIEATGHCCCNGCVGMGPCDLDLGFGDPEERDDTYGDQYMVVS